MQRHRKMANTLYERYPDLVRVRRALQRAEGDFSLFFVECNLPLLRKELATALTQDLTPAPFWVDLATLPVTFAQHLDQLIALQIQDAPPDAPIFLFGLENWLPSLSRDLLRSTVQQLNWRRSAYARLHRPLLIWLPRYAMDLLAEYTPDFYDWYSGVFVFESPVAEQGMAERVSFQAMTSDSGVHAADRLDEAEKKRWLHTLKSLLAGHTQADKGRADLLHQMAYLMNSLGDYAQAQDYYQQSLAISREIGDRSGEGTTLNNLATTAHALGDYASALDYLQQSLAIQREIGDKKGEGKTLNNLSQIYDSRGDYATALDYLQQSLAIRREIGDKSGEGTTLNNLSQIFKARGDYATALDYLQQSLAIRREIGDKSGEGTTLNNLATTAYAKGDYATALDYLQQSLAIQREIGDKSGEGTTLSNLSQIYDARGDYATALDYLQQSLAIQREIGDVAGLCATLFNIGHIYQQNGEQTLAMQYWRESYQIAQKIGHAQSLNALEALAGQIGLPNGLASWAA